MKARKWYPIVACLALSLLFAVPPVANAKPVRSPRIFDINFSLDGGTNPPGAPQSYIGGKGTTLPVPTKANSVFKGWYTDAGLDGNPVSAIGPSESGVKDFWAKWGPGSYLVTFDSAGGRAVDSAAVNDKGRVSKPADPRKTGHTFRRWQLDGAAYDFDTPVTGAITLTAVYTANSYDIDYALNGGTDSDDAPERFTYGKGVRLPIPTHAGHTFQGWFAEAGLNGKPVTAIGDEATGDKRFFAKWGKKGTRRKAPVRRSMIVGDGTGQKPSRPITRNADSRARRYSRNAEPERPLVARSVGERTVAKHHFDCHVRIHSLGSTAIWGRLKPVTPGLMR